MVQGLDPRKKLSEMRTQSPSTGGSAQSAGYGSGGMMHDSVAEGAPSMSSWLNYIKNRRPVWWEHAAPINSAAQQEDVGGYPRWQYQDLQYDVPSANAGNGGYPDTNGMLQEAFNRYMDKINQRHYFWHPAGDVTYTDDREPFWDLFDYYMRSRR